MLLSGLFKKTFSQWNTKGEILQNVPAALLHTSYGKWQQEYSAVCLTDENSHIELGLSHDEKRVLVELFPDYLQTWEYNIVVGSLIFEPWYI